MHGQGQAFSNEVYVGRGRFAAGLGFLVKRMQDIEEISESDHVDHPIGSARIIGDNFAHASAQTVQRLDGGMRPIHFRVIEREPDFIAHLLGK
jgi:hypothetical protein